MSKTLADLFPVRNPYGVVGAMAHVGTADLGVPVMAEGWMFFNTMFHGVEDCAQWFPAQMERYRVEGFRPGANVLLAGNANPELHFKIILDLPAELRPSAVSISAITPREIKILIPFVRALRELGITVVFLTGSLKQWQMFERMLPPDAMPDAPALEGLESAGHVGPCTTQELIEFALPYLLDREVPVPTLVGGGINADNAGILLSKGVGVQIGSEPAMAIESIAHRTYKDDVYAASEKELVVTGGPWFHATHQVRNAFSDEVLSWESEDPRINGAEFLVRAKGSIPRGVLGGDRKKGTFLMGRNVDRITEDRHVADILGEFDFSGVA